MQRIFISYRRDDAGGYVGTLFRDLRRAFGDQVFQDVEKSWPGDNYRDRIERTLAHCDAVVVVIGRDWLARGETGYRRLDDPDDLLRFEIATALRRPGVLVVPVLVGGAQLPSKEVLPDELVPLLDYTAHRVDEGPQREGDVEFLVRVLRRHVEARTALPATLAALFAVVLLLWPAYAAFKALRRAWDRPEELSQMALRLGVLHAVEWVILIAGAAAAFAVLARGLRRAPRAAAAGALAGALGGFVGGALDQALRHQEMPKAGLIAGFALTALIAAAGGLGGRAAPSTILAAVAGAVAGSLLTLLGESEFWSYALPVLGMMVAVAVVRVSRAATHGAPPRALRFGDAARRSHERRVARV